MVVALSGCGSAASDAEPDWREMAITELQRQLDNYPERTRNEEWDEYYLKQARAKLALLKSGKQGTEPEIIWVRLGDSIPWPDTYSVSAALLDIGKRNGVVVRLLRTDGTVLHEESYPLPFAVSGFVWRLTTRDWPADQEKLIRWMGARPPYILLKVPESVLDESLRVEIEQDGRVTDTKEVFVYESRPLQERARAMIAELCDELTSTEDDAFSAEVQAALDFLASRTFVGYVQNVFLANVDAIEPLRKALLAGVAKNCEEEFARPCGAVASLRSLGEGCTQVAFLWMERGFSTTGFYVITDEAEEPAVFEDAFHWDMEEEVDELFAYTLLRGQAVMVCTEAPAMPPARPEYAAYEKGTLQGPLGNVEKVVEVGLIDEDGTRVPAVILSR
jgi:hypothetical protein